MGRKPSAGCVPCKFRRKRCDEKKPTCGGCERNILICRWLTSSSRIDAHGHDAGSTLAQAHKSNLVTVTATALTTIENRKPEPNGASRRFHHIGVFGPCENDAGPNHSFRGCRLRPRPLVLPAEISPRTTVSILSKPDSNFLWHHFIHRTSRVVSARGRSETNPFITLLIPIAISSDLVMQSMLSLSGVHYSETDAAKYSLLASEHYAQALRGLKFGITKFVRGEQDNALELLLTILLLSIMEISGGDANGNAFYHIRAARDLLLNVVRQPVEKINNDTRFFVIEIYAYLAIVSTASTTDQIGLDMPDDLMRMFSLIGNFDSAYVGMLCGSAHSLFGLIPQIFELHRQTRLDFQSGTRPSPAALTRHLSIRRQISEWISQSSDPDFTTCGRIYQLTLFVFLDQTMAAQTGSIYVQSEFASSDNIFNAAIPLLESLPIDAPISSTLCWPLAVLGSCAESQGQRDFVRNRLVGMYECFTIGNIRQTVDLLDKFWANSNTRNPGPFGIFKEMEKYSHPFSFA